MIGRRVLVLAALWLSFPAAAQAQDAATDAQRAVIEAYVALEVARARPGDTHAPEAALAEQVAALSAALRHGRVDLPAVRAEVDVQLAEVEARLREVGATCGPIADPAPARARRDALTIVRAALERGPFVPR